jgi:hypothetical protein
VLDGSNPAVLSNVKQAYSYWKSAGCGLSACPCAPIPPGGASCKPVGPGSCLGRCSP